MSDAKDERWGNYLLMERIGSGGMCEVFRARRLGAADWSRDVCLKRLHGPLCRDAEFIRLFHNEAMTGAKLRHRNIVSVEDFGEHQGRYFLAMEFVHGVDLARLEARIRQTRTPLDPSIGAFVLYELLRALEVAQNTIDPDTGRALRVIHRDVSPHNVLVSFNGEVKLSDFGIALAAGRVQAALSNTVRGKFGYIPLEQARAQQLDGRADLFALGVTLFELLAGQRPFCGTHSSPTFELILAAQLVNDRPSLSTLRPDLPTPLLQLIEQLLAPLPDDRPRDATEALRILESLPEIHEGGLALRRLIALLYPGHASVAQPTVAKSTASSMAFAPTKNDSIVLGPKVNARRPRLSMGIVAGALAITSATAAGIGLTRTHNAPSGSLAASTPTVSAQASVTPAPPNPIPTQPPAVQPLVSTAEIVPPRPVSDALYRPTKTALRTHRTAAPAHRLPAVQPMAVHGTVVEPPSTLPVNTEPEIELR